MIADVVLAIAALLLIYLPYSFIRDGIASLPPNIQKPTDNLLVPYYKQQFIYRRKGDPASFWLVVIAYLVFSTVLFVAAAMRVYRAL
jgi:RsiW-degrading membrane proteinase PrsW (M82 family)